MTAYKGLVGNDDPASKEKTMAMNTHLSSQQSAPNERIRTMIAKAGWLAIAAAALVFAFFIASAENPRDNFKLFHKVHDSNVKDAGDIY